MTRTEEKRQEKLGRVLQTASELFAISEYHQVGMDAIARDAGVGKGTLYNLFESKDDLYFSIIRMRLSELLSDLEHACDRPNQPIENIRILVRHLYDFMAKHHYFYMIWKREERGINGTDYHREITLIQQRADELVLAVLKSGESTGVLAAGLDHRLVTRVIFGLVDALIQEHADSRGIDSKIDSVFQMLMCGIGGSGVESRHDPYKGHRSDSLPLNGRRIVVTRSRNQSHGLVSGLTLLGAELGEIPTIEIKPPDSYDEIDDAISRLDDYDWMVFTSQNGVASFFKRARALGLEAGAFNRLKYAAVGKVTAGELLSHGIQADLVPRKRSSTDLLNAFDDKHVDLETVRVLFPCSDLSQDTMLLGVTERGGSIDRIVVYRTIEPDVAPQKLACVLDPQPDLVTFTSPSTVRNYRRLLERNGHLAAIREIPGSSIGPVTTKAAAEAGIEIVAESREASARSMVESIYQYFSQVQGGR